MTAIHAAKQGYTLYNHIRILGQGWHMMAVGDGIRENRDAEWLAQQMSAAAGVNPAPSIPSNTNAEIPQMIDAFMIEFLGKTSARRFASLNSKLGRPEKHQ